MPEITISLESDGNGRFQSTREFNPPGFLNLTVDLIATLRSPADTTVIGEMDIDAKDGSPANNARPFRAATGDRVSLGSWKLDGGDNKVVVSGKTEPARPHTTLIIELEARL